MLVAGLFVGFAAMVVIRKLKKRYKDKATQTEKLYSAVEFEQIEFDPPEPWDGKDVDDGWPERLLRTDMLKESYCKVKQT